MTQELFIVEYQDGEIDDGHDMGGFTVYLDRASAEDGLGNLEEEDGAAVVRFVREDLAQVAALTAERDAARGEAETLKAKWKREECAHCDERPGGHQGSIWCAECFEWYCRESEKEFIEQLQADLTTAKVDAARAVEALRRGEELAQEACDLLWAENNMFTDAEQALFDWVESVNWVHDSRPALDWHNARIAEAVQEAKAEAARAGEALEAEQRAAHWRNLARITDKHEDALEASRLSEIAQRLRHGIVLNLSGNITALDWLAAQRREAAAEELEAKGRKFKSYRHSNDFVNIAYEVLANELFERAAALRAGEVTE